MEGCSLLEAARRIQTISCSSSSPDQSKPASNERELVTKERRVSSALNFTLTGIDYSHPYLADRGIAKETAIEFGVGFYSGPGLMRDRLVIPIHNADGQLIAYCGRSVDQTQPRYRLPPALTKSQSYDHTAPSG